MTKRKGKSSNKQDESLVLLEPSVAQQKALKEYAVPVAIFLIFVVGGSTAVWFCCQQQQTIDSLTESVNTMQLRITKFQQQLGMGNAQSTSVAVFEERLQALEEAYTQAEKKAEVALATSEKIKSTDLHSQVWSLQSEMNTKLSELQQTTVSTATLNAVLKNKTEELEKLKQRLNSVLTANSEVAVSISGLTDTVLITTSRLEEQISAVDGLTSRFEQQKSEIASLKESFADNQKALKRNRQEVIDIKDLLEMEQVKRTQALEDQLMSVRRSLEDHQKSTHSLHSHLAAQIEIVQNQMLSQSQEPEEEVQKQEQHAATKKELVPFEDEEVESQTITEEEANTGDGDVEQMEEPVQDDHVLDEEGVEEQDKENEIPEEQYDVAEDQALTGENEQAEEVQVKEASKQEETPEELEVKDNVDEDQMVSEEEAKAEDLQLQGEEHVEKYQGKDDVAEETAATEEIGVHVEEADEQQTEADDADQQVENNNQDKMEHVYDSKEEKPAEKLEEEQDEQDISTSDA